MSHRPGSSAMPFTDSVARRKGARAAEWDGLENRCGCMPTVGSNPTPSAILLR